MKTYDLNFNVGYSMTMEQNPKEMFPARIPGAVQLDYAAYKGWGPFYQGVNFKDYAWMEDVYWYYHAPLNFTLEAGQSAQVWFKGIDYKYRISVNGEVLCENEGMFSHVSVDVSRFAGKTGDLEVMIYPIPKADDSNTRSQAAKSCKSAACYGWDWCYS